MYGQYGPSEASINSAWKDFSNGGEATNIGRAIGSVSWVIDPEKRSVAVYTAAGAEVLDAGDTLDGGDVVPGFSLPVADLFA